MTGFYEKVIERGVLNLSDSSSQADFSRAIPLRYPIH